MFNSLVESYETALLESSSTLNTVETTLRQLTWFLPGRFEDAEIASEGLYSALSVVALYHDSIVQGRIDRLDRLPRSPFPQITPYTLGSDSITGKDGRNDDRMSGSASGSKMDTSFTPIPPLSDHARYTRHFCKTSKTYSRAGRLLMFIQHTQLLLEMIVRKRKGNEKRWEVLCWLEGIKSVLKMTMLVSTGRPLPSTPLPGREIDPSLLPSKNPSPSPLLDPEPTHKIAQITSLSSAPLHTHVIPLNESLPPSLQTAPEDLLPRLRGGREWLGEMMNATEGLVAVLTFITIARRSKREGLGRGKSSLSELARSTSTSTIVPLLYILISRTLRRRTGGGKGDKDLTCLLAETYAGRDRELLWYFLRGSLWQNYMRIKGMRVLDGMSRVWGLGLVAGLVRDHLDLVDDLFYYTSN